MLERGISNPALEENTAGWISRYMQTLVTPTDFAVVTSAPQIPVVAQDVGTLHIRRASDLSVSSPLKQTMLQSVYNGGTDLISQCGKEALSAITAFQAAASGYVNSSGYGTDPLSQNFQIIAEMIKLRVGVQLAEVEYSQWDHHADEDGQFPDSVATLSAGLTSFWNDMTAAGLSTSVTVVVVSEFGRRVAANGSGGTDHGHGTVTLVLGGKVRGGKMYGKWLGLSPAVLSNGDIPVTTDQRAIFSEVLTATRGPISPSIFPGLPTYTPLGLI
jgi:uncharacterized protein (DUF1501 family)